MQSEIMQWSASTSLRQQEIADILSNMSNSHQARRLEATPDNWKLAKPGGGGKSFAYVKIAAFYRWLDKNYPGWSMEVVVGSVYQVANFIHVAVKLTVVESNGVTRTITSYGADEAILKDGNLISHPYVKSAESDALKRCVVKLGGFNDVYSEIEAEQEPISDAKAVWYTGNVLPVVLKRLPATTVFKQMEAFANNLITKQDLVDLVNKLENKA